jgi:hypothetical protein
LVVPKGQRIPDQAIASSVPVPDRRSRTVGPGRSSFGTFLFVSSAKGRAAPFHLILARAWERDIHYVRDVALAAATREL